MSKSKKERESQATGRRWTQWKEPDARKALGAWRMSGLSAAAFCAREGYSETRLRYGSSGSASSRARARRPCRSFPWPWRTYSAPATSRSSTTAWCCGCARTSMSNTWRGSWPRSRLRSRRADAAARQRGVLGDRSRGRSQGHQRPVDAGAVAVRAGPAVGPAVRVFLAPRRSRARPLLGPRRVRPDHKPTVFTLHLFRIEKRVLSFWPLDHAWQSRGRQVGPTGCNASLAGSQAPRKAIGSCSRGAL